MIVLSSDSDCRTALIHNPASIVFKGHSRLSPRLPRECDPELQCPVASLQPCVSMCVGNTARAPLKPAFRSRYVKKARTAKLLWQAVTVVKVDVVYLCRSYRLGCADR